VDLKFSTYKVCADLKFSACTCTTKTRDQLGCPLLDPCIFPLSKRNIFLWIFAPLLTPLFTTAFLFQRGLVGDWELGEVQEVRAVLRLVI